MKIKNIVFALQLIFLFFSLPAYAESMPVCSPGSSCHQTITVNGIQRSFIYNLPKSYTRNQHYYNLVFALHGAGETGEFLEKNILLGKLDTIGLHGGSITVYPDAINGNWNYGFGALASSDDLAFMDALITYFETNYFTNPFRIYVAGFSEGGFLAFRLACERAEVITAIATVASAMPTGLVESCKPLRHVPVLMINGKNDPLLPWDGHEIVSATGQKQGDRLSVPETYRAWAAINNIHTVDYQQPYTGLRLDSTWAWSTTAKAADGADVTLYTIYQGGHSWPGGTQYLPKQAIGNTSTINASTIIWQFFISKRLKPLFIPNYKKAQG
jgi:polyhydroxybutyrate depolymerase